MRRKWGAVLGLGAKASLRGLGLCLSSLLGFSSAQAIDMSTLMPSSAFSYDTSALNNPYLRSNNFYGFDRLTRDDEDGLGSVFGDVSIPLITNIGVSPFYNDNVLYNNENRKTAFGSSFTPSFIVPFGSSKVMSLLSYSLASTVYQGLSYANTTSHFINSTTAFEFDHRNHLVVVARGMPQAQDALGTYFSQGNVANVLKTPNTWSGYGFDANYRYGGQTSKGNLLFNFSMDNHVYSNNPQYTASRSLNAYTFGSAFLWRALPKTQFLIEANDTLLDYMNPYTYGTTGPTLSGSLYRAYTGVTWEASARTRLVVKGGYQVRTYNSSSFQTQTGPAFQAMLRWQPRQQDTLWVEAVNSINEAYIGSATATNMQTFSVNWSHNWLERFRTQWTASYLNQSYTTTDVTNRSIYTSINALYTIRQGMWLDLQYNYTDRTSNLNQYDFNRNLVQLNYRIMF